MKDNDIVVLELGRTATGIAGGALSNIPASQLGATVIKEILRRLSLPASSVDEVIIGQVLTAGCGQNPARQTAIYAGLEESVTAVTVNQVCGSGLKAIQLAMQSIRNGDAALIIAGGQENMSLSPHLIPHSRKGVKMGEWKLLDSMIKDGLWDAFNDYHMGHTAENIAERWEITRAEQDEFALMSQQKARCALAGHAFADEIIPITVSHHKHEDFVFCRDEGPRPDTTLSALAKLKPVFKKEGTVTAGNASGINDGAAMVVLASGKKAKELGIKPIAIIRSVATAGVEPAYMGTGPVPASRIALSRAGWSVHELELIESNEAFAAQAILVNREMGWNNGIVNVNGGAIALGHPIGASGTRIFVSLVYEMKRRNARKGLATLCIGGGMGIATTVELI
ncbi:acetyl-CoA C-acetyltransferase [Lelliottia amnigena]|uniref:acetyl-CoA C-acetyltransferase n=1 Tax=Lelliottia TaxID=1330545 RepID=UPI00192C8C7E|nr:acetyl-CoA C-acetyltransferase [Lelliottia aquatilis]MBL5923892.1 acetyl-CoA C-acetyltransferase [Lelliottia amnigena]MBL5932737.1 acetyl-CoA C-acetyltransferase [Lelliottia amnigena]